MEHLGRETALDPAFQWMIRVSRFEKRSAVPG
jgi:hypothetical protein